jgi:hypothetical protein
MTTKELLSANRESVISSIKFVFKIYRQEDVIKKMIEFLAYAEKWIDVEKTANAKNTKTLLKYAVQKMAISQMPEKDSRKWYEVKHDYAESIGCEVNTLTGKIYKVN